MLLNLKDLFAGAQSDIHFDYKMDISGYEIRGEYPFKEPVRVYGNVTNRAGAVTLKAQTEFRFHTHCDRCLVDIQEHRELSFENLLAKSVSNQNEVEDILVCENATLDLDELVISNIVLNLPMKHLCKESCRGLCPVCGKNLNDGDCGCQLKA